MKNATLVILAAGMGSRYGGLKQIDGVGPAGEAVIDYSIYDALRAGFDRLVFVIRPEIEAQVRAHVARGPGRSTPTEYVCQELSAIPRGFSVSADRRKPWGTAHAVLVCAETVREPFAVINADDFYGRRSFEALAGVLRNVEVSETRYFMVGFSLRDTLSDHGAVARGVCEVDEAGFLKASVERTRIEKQGGAARFLADDGQWRPLSGSERVSMNMWGFTPTVFLHMERHFAEFLSGAGTDPKKEFYIPFVVDSMIRSGTATVQVLSSGSKWFGVTYPEDKASVSANIRRLVDAGEYPASLRTAP